MKRFVSCVAFALLAACGGEAGMGEQEPAGATEDSAPVGNVSEAMKWTPNPAPWVPCPDGHGHTCLCQGNVMDCRMVVYTRR